MENLMTTTSLPLQAGAFVWGLFTYSWGSPLFYGDPLGNLCGRPVYFKR